ncbi:MAG: hypothetical protein ACKPER_03895, partial [Dolichospermum sp.]
CCPKIKDIGVGNFAPKPAPFTVKPTPANLSSFSKSSIPKEMAFGLVMKLSVSNRKHHLRLQNLIDAC